MQTKRVPFLPKKAPTLNWFVLAIQICRLKKINRAGGRKNFRARHNCDTQKTNSRPDTGLAKHGDKMKAADVLKELEKHEAECSIRYSNIEQQLSDQKISLKSLDNKVWALAVLVIIAPFASKLLG